MTEKLSDRYCQYYNKEYCGEYPCGGGIYKCYPWQLGRIMALEAENNHLKAELSKRPERIEVDPDKITIHIDERIKSLEAKLSVANFLVEHYKNSFKVHYDRAESAEREREQLKDQITCEKFAVQEVIRDRQKVELERDALKEQIDYMDKRVEDLNLMLDDSRNRLAEAKKPIKEMCNIFNSECQRSHEESYTLLEFEFEKLLKALGGGGE